MHIKEFIKNKNIIELQGAQTACLTAILNCTIQNPFEEDSQGDVLIYGNKIVAVNEVDFSFDAKNIVIIDGKDKILTPGLIEQHIHGGYGVDFNNCSDKQAKTFLQNIYSRGITTVLPTIMTDEIEHIKKQISVLKNLNFEGINLEGPFLSPKFKGIHPEDKLIKPSIEAYQLLEDDFVKLVTLAPELDDDFELIKYLTNKNVVVSAGHCNLSLEITKEAIKNGVQQVTHLFNAMSPIHHRKPGIITEALLNKDVYVEIIADCEHLHPKILEMIFKLKNKEKIIMISDSLPLNSSGLKSITFGGQQIFNRNNKAQSVDGIFAGSMMFLDDIFRNLFAQKLVNFSDFIGYASLNPALNLGFKDLGKIKENYKANLVLWDKNYKAVQTFVNGKQVFSQ